MKHRIISGILVIVLAFTFVFSLVGCSSEKAITVEDGNTRTKINAKVGTTVAQALEEADLSLKEKDETEPDRDTEITDDLSEIKIKRYAKVTIVYDGKKTEVELVGGTVSDAIKKSNLKLSDKNKLDKELSAYLEDGMVIKVLSAAVVSLTADGKTEEYKTDAKTVKDFLDENEVKLGKDDIISPKTTEPVTDGMKIVIKRVTYKEVVEKEVIKFEKKEEKSAEIPKGNSKLTTKGVNGEKEVTYRVKYIDGKEDSKEKVSEKVTKKAVDQVVTKGTGPSTAGGSSSSSQVSDDNYDYDDDYDYDYDSDDSGSGSGTSSQQPATEMKIDEATIGDVE